MDHLTLAPYDPTVYHWASQAGNSGQTPPPPSGFAKQPPQESRTPGKVIAQKEFFVTVRLLTLLLCGRHLLPSCVWATDCIGSCTHTGSSLTSACDHDVLSTVSGYMFLILLGAEHLQQHSVRLCHYHDDVNAWSVVNMHGDMPSTGETGASLLVALLSVCRHSRTCQQLNFSIAQQHLACKQGTCISPMMPCPDTVLLYGFMYV